MKKIIIILATVFTMQAQATLLIGTINDIVNSIVITVASPFISTGATTVAAVEGREEVLKAVKADAYTYLTTGESSEALDAVLGTLSSDVDELKNKDRVELASLIIVSID